MCEIAAKLITPSVPIPSGSYQKFGEHRQRQAAWVFDGEPLPGQTEEPLPVRPASCAATPRYREFRDVVFEDVGF